MNRVVLIGRLTKDPQLRFVAGSGKAVSNFTIAIDRRFKSPGYPEADFIPIVVWGKQAEAAANYIGKGNLVSVSGRIQTRNYEAKDGTRRYITEVVAEQVEFLEWNKKQEGQGEVQAKTENNNSNDVNLYDEDITPIDDSDIPF